MRRFSGKMSVAVLSAVALTAGTFTATAAHASGPLREHAEQRGIEIGVAINDGLLSNQQYASIAGSEFSQVTAENVMKWETLQPSQGQFNWGQADQIVDFAKQNNQRVYGHTLVWHSQTPGWVQGLGAGEMDTAMREHINAVLGRYGDDVEVWDVANEVIGDNAQLRNSFWLQTLGEDYIANAFEYARQADPDAELCLNDYSIDGINAKSDAYYQLAQDLLARGVPLTCMGFQAHLILGQVPSDMQQNLQRFADLGLDVYVTELDIRMDLNGGAPTQQQLAQQAEDYRSVVEACLGVERCKGLTTWGVHDASSWVPDQFPGQGAPLMWDDNYQQKPAYTAVHDTLAGD